LYENKGGETMLTEAEIKRFISDDMTSEKKRLAGVGQRYYEAEHDILKCRLFYYNADGKLVEDTTRSNIKISHPFFMILADQLSAYALSSKKNPIQAKKNDDGLQDILDEAFDDEFWDAISDLITGAYAKGFEYLYAYKNEDNKLVFQCADSMGVVEVREKDTDDGCKYFIYWYIDRIDKGKKTIKRIQVWSETDVTYYVQSGKSDRITLDDSVAVNPRPHVIYTDPKTGKKMGYGLGYIPFWRLDNNRKQFSGLKPIKGLIDDYDLHACSLSNNLKDFDTPLYVVSGFQGDNLDELQQNLKTKKIVGVDSEGSVTVQTVDIPYQARKEKLDLDKEAIFTFGMGFDPTQVGDGNITNVVILSRYTLLDLKKSKLDKRVKKLLKEVIKIKLAEINKENGTDYQMKDIKIDLTPDIPTNESENITNEKTKAETQQIRINTILNIAANVGDEQTLKAICDELDLNYDEIKGQVEKMRKEEQSTANAIATLEGVVTDEPQTETSPETVPE
jgi:SPP1 family phage portal protein